MKLKFFFQALCYAGLPVFPVLGHTQPIDRQALVQRHNVQVRQVDSLSSLTVGNGAFAFTVDATGLQTFPGTYAKGVPLGTQSEWGWDTFPNTAGYRFEESLKHYPLHGREISYGVQWNENGRHKDAANYFRQNPHRLQLGNLGFALVKSNGSLAGPADISGIVQTLDLWTGLVHSRFLFDGKEVKVTTACHPERDWIGVTVESEWIALQRLQIQLAFPYPTGEWADVGNNHGMAQAHHSEVMRQDEHAATWKHALQGSQYFVQGKWTTTARLSESSPHHFTITPAGGKRFDAVFSFSSQALPPIDLNADEVQQRSAEGWMAFWKSGGAVDFSGSTDARAHELERRVILSQYLTRVQCAGQFPPQETGLTYNSWFGKPHLEMHWWHAVHYALWGRTALLEKSLEWYFRVLGPAKALAARQGYPGARWQKMVDHQGNESPSSVGAFLIWQQPHPITMAELVYRNDQSGTVLEKYKELVFATADFMAGFAFYDSVRQRYVLGPGVIPAQERFKPELTVNPTYELNYWHWALATAQQWRLRVGMKRNPAWDKVLNLLSPLPVQDGVYLAAESAKDSYTNPVFKTDHPSVLGTLGMLPATAMTDSATMRSTFDLVWNTWTWDDTWGWDFPMTAMTATRLGLPDRAIDALLMPIRTNAYLVNGHNYQDDRLRIYLPGNGGVLAAVAMMVAGYDGHAREMPGIPKDGSWRVRWEGLKSMP